MSQWIWKFGEFEIYHNLLLHNRRQQYGYPEPTVWKLYTPEPVVCFKKSVVTDGGTFRIYACGNSSVSVEYPEGGLKKYGGIKEVHLRPGKAEICIRVGNIETFPCVYVEGVIESDGSWLADDLTYNWESVGTYECFDSPIKRPEVFPFAYEKVEYVKREILENGILFDFGGETFARTKISGLESGKVKVQFGESKEEALDSRWSVIQFEDTPKGGSLSYDPCAFRYIFINFINHVVNESVEVEAEYEYLPIVYRGAFSCNEEIVNKVWDMAAYTFHLNSREFFLDGIKRDRWVWSADAYQSLFVNRYLFMNQEIEKRTLIALGGKSPFKAHINTIMDYSFFWIISLYEYYITYGDKKFLEQIAPQMDEVIQFCKGRTDTDGFMREKPGDWIFIDWAPMDKAGALCGEQILYAKALECYGDICHVLGRAEQNSSAQARELRQSIFDKFYDKEKRVFIDCYESGKASVTRQNNILAYLFLPCSKEQKEAIYRNVILNDEVPQITTPYFKFYENQVHCLAGNGKLLEASIRDYYGSMLATGATTLYEEYDPNAKGTEHYAMYGNPYEKSLCHAWSASPIYLLGNFRMGVQNTGIGYETFEVRPKLGDLQEFAGVVPLPVGEVSVAMNKKEVRVRATASGGTLYIADMEIPLQNGKEVIVNLDTAR